MKTTKSRKLSKAKIEELSHLTGEELYLVNDTVERLLDHRPLVLMAAAAHIVGTVARGSGGLMSIDRVTKLVRELVQ